MASMLYHINFNRKFNEIFWLGSFFLQYMPTGTASHQRRIASGTEPGVFRAITPGFFDRNFIASVPLVRYNYGKILTVRRERGATVAAIGG